MEYIVALIPVIVFLLIMVYLDSFKLVKNETISYCVLWGVTCAVISIFLNDFLQTMLEMREEVYLGMVSPLIEETLKSLLLVFFLMKSKIIFRIDGAIYGFAIGTGFALLENIYLISMLDYDNIWIWVTKGFGTAFMHGGATSILAILLMQAKEKHLNLFKYFIIGWIVAVLIHSLYNYFLVSSVVSMVIILVVVTVIEIVILKLNERMLRDWLELEFISEVKLLGMIKKGEFLKTKSGEYMVSIRDNFSKLVVLNMMSYISIYVELSIKAKSNLMLNEVGMPGLKDKDIQIKLSELKSLEKNIGRTGLIAISPILRVSKKNLIKWSLL